MFVGFGYDVHRLQAGRRLVLGGVEIDFEQGLLGHSDADVLIHAVMDALLGAAGLGDIGEIFPDTDEKFAGACSLDLLRRVGDLLYNSGLRVNNIDCTVVAERPKIAQYKRQMAANIAEVLGIPPTRVNVKATTEEGLGLAGAGIGTYAVATLLRMENGEWRIRDGGYG